MIPSFVSRNYDTKLTADQKVQFSQATCNLLKISESLARFECEVDIIGFFIYCCRGFQNTLNF